MAFHTDQERHVFTYTCDYCRESKLESNKPGELFEKYAHDWRQARDENGDKLDMCPSCWKRRWSK